MNYVIMSFLTMFLKNTTINTGLQGRNQGHGCGEAKASNLISALALRSI